MPFDQGPGQFIDPLQAGRDVLFQGVGGSLHQEFGQVRVIGPVSQDQALVDAPGGLNRRMAF